MPAEQMKKPPPLFKVKPRSRVSTGNRFAKLKALKCFAEVNQRIADGWPLSQIAKFIQIDRKEYTDVTVPSLVSVLTEYRASLKPTEVIKNKPSMLPTVIKAEAELQEGLDELAELEKLYKIQLDRIYIDHEKEKMIKKLFTSMTPEIRAAKDILVARAQLKMDLGVTDRHLGTAEVEVNVSADIAARHGSPAVKKVLEDDSSRRKVLGIAEKFMALAATKRADALSAVELPDQDFPKDEPSADSELPPDFSFDKDPDAVEDEAETPSVEGAA